MGALISLIAVAALALVAWVGSGFGDGARFFIGVVVPGVAFAVFAFGIAARVIGWARIPVPFRIPTTGGQQKSLGWVRNEELDNPSGGWGVIGRMALEILFFRSLFRNTTAEVRPGDQKITYDSAKMLWAVGLIFHWTMLIVVLRHFRFFVEPVPQWVQILQSLDGFFEIGLPVVYVTTIGMIAGLVYLLGRRLLDSQVRYISLPSDYFALFLLLGIAISGALMRHLEKVDVAQVKAAIAGWASFQPVTPTGVGSMYFVHVLLVSVLLVVFPFSKLLHAPGVFFSPTRNLANSNRARRHENPWNPDIEGHTYAEWEEEFRDKLVASGIPLDKE